MIPRDTPAGTRVIYHNHDGTGVPGYNGRTATTINAILPEAHSVEIRWDQNDRIYYPNMANLDLLPATPTTHSTWSSS